MPSIEFQPALPFLFEKVVEQTVDKKKERNRLHPKRVMQRVSKVVSNAASNIAKSYETFVEHVDCWKKLTRTTRFANSSYSEKMRQTFYDTT